MYIVVSYVVYLVVSVCATIWVASTLHRNGRVFLLDAFHGNAEQADSVNHLLVVGFYLVNVGYVTLALRTDAALASVRQAIELVCDKVGVVLVVLGLMHFLNLYLFSRLRKRAGERAERRHAPPAGWNPALANPAAPLGKVLE